jgi:hypothetical protein
MSRICIALLALATLAGAAPADPRDNGHDGDRRGEHRRPLIVQWSPREIRDLVEPGQIATYTATFTSNRDMDDVQLRLTPGLARFATLDATSIAHVAAGTPTSVQITLTVPSLPATASTEDIRASFHGLVLMRAAGRPVPAALKLRFHMRIDAPSTDDPAGSGQ